MKKLLLSIIVMCVLSLLSCSTWDKIVGTDYWNEECIERYAVYDSSNFIPKKWYHGQTMIVYMTDSTDTLCCAIIWGKECNFTPGEMLYIKAKRWHSPGTGTPYWKEFLVNENQSLIYTIF
jgi:hypothetical protein